MKSRYTGLRAWLVQRVSAVYMFLFIVFFVAHFAVDSPQSYPGWHAWITSSAMTIATTAFFAALLAHAWVGLRDVLMDYVQAMAVRVALLGLVGFGLTAVGVWVLRLLWTRHG
ncbi:MAG TPA: succinate dehydrogenase, hydrophobic membrane anchor protein [Gemmatimonadaceae bacterium]